MSYMAAVRRRGMRAPCESRQRRRGWAISRRVRSDELCEVGELRSSGACRPCRQPTSGITLFERYE